MGNSQCDTTCVVRDGIGSWKPGKYMVRVSNELFFVILAFFYRTVEGDNKPKRTRDGERCKHEVPVWNVEMHFQ